MDRPCFLLTKFSCVICDRCSMKSVTKRPESALACLGSTLDHQAYNIGINKVIGWFCANPLQKPCRSLCAATKQGSKNIFTNENQKTNSKSNLRRFRPQT